MRANQEYLSMKSENRQSNSLELKESLGFQPKGLIGVKSNQLLLAQQHVDTMNDVERRLQNISSLHA